MKYQCCVCISKFEGNQIKDGFNNGVKEGFLCPVCGTNIKDDMCGQTVFVQKAKGTFLFYVILLIIFFLDTKIEQYLSTPLDANNWLVLSALLGLAVSIYVFVNRNLLKETNILTTQRVSTKRKSI
ncbi:hypothetical protein HII17_06040 [Thalassotalea sp. M1531]|uniref:Uncharacterized protein n=1 Tax=Thalassotalea algicola TaxID=2716224 RepID=A0A7Y0LB11_9GAMM|nr:hypothetical protein [Thalassotalea algicola]NMP31121.1 hypothetical protein [Thalassotalea algicola]